MTMQDELARLAEEVSKAANSAYADGQTDTATLLHRWSVTIDALVAATKAEGAQETCPDCHTETDYRDGIDNSVVHRCPKHSRAEGAQAPVAWRVCIGESRFSWSDGVPNEAQIRGVEDAGGRIEYAYTAPQSLPDSALVRAYRESIFQFLRQHWPAPNRVPMPAYQIADWIEQRAREISSAG